VGRAAFDRTSAYVALRDGRLAAVSLTTGGVRWSTNEGVTAPPAALEGLVLAIKGATLVGLDSTNGNMRWQQALGAPSVLAPTVGPNWIAVITTKPEVLLLHPTDGRILWRQILAAPARALPTGDTDRIFIGLTNGQAIALSARNGAAQWTRTVGGEPLVLTLNKDRVFVGTSDDYLCALVADSGRHMWRWRTGGAVRGAVAADDKRVYFASLDNSLVALGRGGGDLKWEQRLRSRPVGGPVLIGDTLLLVTVAGEFNTFAIERGTETESVALAGRPLHQPHLIPWAGPVPPRAIVLTAGGQLLAMGPIVEPPVVPLDLMAGKVVLLPETLDPIEPPLVPMLYPPGRLLLPETLPPAVVKRIPIRRP
jgi:outer membrane protein assembly factor BamB